MKYQQEVEKNFRSNELRRFVAENGHGRLREVFALTPERYARICGISATFFLPPSQLFARLLGSCKVEVESEG